MAIDPTTLDHLARAYTKGMTNIRGRRVHRLVMREFGSFDVVVWAEVDDGTPALLAIDMDGRLAVCRTDGTGREGLAGRGS